MAGKAQKGTLPQRCLEAVLAGASTVAEVLAVVGRTISAPQACRRCRTADSIIRKPGRSHKSGPLQHVRTNREAAARGRRQLVADVLGVLCKRGFITRISRGAYGPLPPKLFQPAQTA